MLFRKEMSELSRAEPAESSRRISLFTNEFFLTEESDIYWDK